MKINKKKVVGWVKVFIIVYCTIGIALYYLQEKFLFHPVVLADDHIFTFKEKFEELRIPLNEEESISLVKFFPKDSVRKGVVVYYHGNMKNIEHYAAFAVNFTRNGYEVWMQDYPGFGKSKGERTEEKLYSQAIQVRKMAGAQFNDDSIIVFGKSLGTGLAAYVASLSKNKMLVLETPYYSIPDLFHSFTFIYPSAYMSTYKLPTWKYLQDVTEPIIIFQGDNDWITPYRSAVKLKRYLKPEDQFIVINNGSHNNLNEFKTYHQVLDSLMK